MDAYSVPYADVIKSNQHKDLFIALESRLTPIRLSSCNFHGQLNEEPNKATFTAAVVALVKMFRDRHGELPVFPVGKSYLSFMTSLFLVACENKLCTPLADVPYNCAAINLWDSIFFICDSFSHASVKSWSYVPANLTARCLRLFKEAIPFYTDYLDLLRGTFMELSDRIGGVMYIYPS